MIEEKLKLLGLSDNEIRVYLCVLENTKITPTMVAKRTGVSRPTAYGVGKSLVDKGFIEMDELSPTLYFIALPPENVARMVRQEKLKIEDKIKTAESLVGELALVPRSKNYSIPKVRFIDENNFEDFLYKQSPIWNQSGIKGDATWWGFQDHDFVEQYPEWFKWYFGFSAGKIKSKLITNVEEKEKMGEVIHLDYERAAKYWGGGDKIKITHAVLGDYILIANTQTKPHYVVEIHDAVIANNLREIFKGFWELLP